MKLFRREFLHLAAGAAALLPVPRALAAPAAVIQGAGGASGPQPAEPSPAERVAMAALARDYMQKYAVPGLSVAIGHGGRIVYADAFGMADREQRQPLTPSHLFRIASVSKPITSVAI